MTTRTTERSALVYARVAGLAYVVTILLGILSVSFIESNLIVPVDDAATLNNIMANEFLFRISIVGEIMMFALVILLSMSLYVILKTVDRNLALLALLWRLAEAIVGAGITVLSGLVPLLLINDKAAYEPEQLAALVGLFLGTRSAGLDFVLIFIGLGGTIFCYLFFKSRYVPRFLAGWGIFTYVTMLVVSFASILFNVQEETKMLFYAPGGLFEIIFGLWLLIKGVNVREWEKRAPGS